VKGEVTDGFAGMVADFGSAPRHENDPPRWPFRMMCVERIYLDKHDPRMQCALPHNETLRSL
jgi:hypothetical protein